MRIERLSIESVQQIPTAGICSDLDIITKQGSRALSLNSGAKIIDDSGAQTFVGVFKPNDALEESADWCLHPYSVELLPHIKEVVKAIFAPSDEDITINTYDVKSPQNCIYFTINL